MIFKVDTVPSSLVLLVGVGDEFRLSEHLSEVTFIYSTSIFYLAISASKTLQNGRISNGLAACRISGIWYPTKVLSVSVTFNNRVEIIRQGVNLITILSNKIVDQTLDHKFRIYVK